MAIYFRDHICSRTLGNWYDRFLARYAPPQTEILHFQPDADGQLSLLNFEIESVDEPPDPNDFNTLEAFREAIARWDREHPIGSDQLPNSQDNDVSTQDKPLELSNDSFCLWAHCPAYWYEPVEVIEASKVMEMSPTCKSSSTSDFYIPTFDGWGDSNRSDEPPDMGIFAKLPKPTPPKFPPQTAATWRQLGHKLNTTRTPQVSLIQPKSDQVPKLSRNYPETISPRR